MDATLLLDACWEAGIRFYTGVPDSQLKGLCDALFDKYGASGAEHIVAANEGNAIGLCAGHYLATGHPALCYMQNSGLGNAVNPLASLMDEAVYGLPCLLVIGWRGEPGVHDEPQHVKQGAVTLEQLELLGIPYWVLDKDMDGEVFRRMFDRALAVLADGRSAAIVVRKGALSCAAKPDYANGRAMTRETAAEIILAAGEEKDVFVSTTGKLSREVFELREARNQGHQQDFLTVGSMGHAGMIALGIALAQPDRRVWCLDGDGAALMHLGALHVLGQRQPKNLIHVVINNGAHETVGGMPVCEGGLDVSAAARAAKYPCVLRAEDPASLAEGLAQAKACGSLCLVEVLCANGARANLGRPTTTPRENRDALMAFLQEDKA